MKVTPRFVPDDPACEVWGAYAGVHLYCETGDNLTANRSWLGLHAAAAGTKRLRLPRPVRVHDAIHDRLIGAGLSELEIDLKAGETALFMIGHAAGGAGYVTRDRQTLVRASGDR